MEKLFYSRIFPKRKNLPLKFGEIEEKVKFPSGTLASTVSDCEDSKEYPLNHWATSTSH